MSHNELCDISAKLMDDVRYDEELEPKLQSFDKSTATETETRRAFRSDHRSELK